ncbi:cell division protein FtsK [Mycobacteroides abscessus subsp. abscessus]|uniref:cell division protein FtsK n=1 Tax=Mycobacteroides abscessus TaxID=36809 RepID=UPI00266CE882|nr:cell division protein FtsK [Mycobacteroides abscessus]MDO3013219.1 cell division protein FtsK [Mycobacteroides abscessus subsp. abscessus]
MSRDARRAALARKREKREEFFFQRDIKMHDMNSLAAIKDSEKADLERERLAEKLEAIAQRASVDAARAVAEREKFWSGEEKRLLTQARIVRTGGSQGTPPIWLCHWRASLPAALATRLGVSSSDAGPVFALRPGGGISESDVISAVVRCEAPELASDPTFVGWADGVESLLPDLAQRYSVLERVRDDRWLARLFEAAGVATSETRVEAVHGEYGVYERKLSAVDVPSLGAAEVDESGLVLRFAHRTGDSADKWSRGLSALRSGFAHAGVKAENLRVLDGPEGTIELRFEDAPDVFPKALAPEPPSAVVGTVSEAIARYHSAEWVMGVDARGQWLTYALTDHPHAFVVGGTGGGKSVWVRTQVEMLRTGYRDPRTGHDAGGGWRLFIASGKPSDFAGLEGLPGIQMVATDTAQLVVMLQAVKSEMDRRIVSAAQAKREGKGATAFDFPPIAVVLDEFGYLGMNILSQYGTKGLKWFRLLVDSLLRVARETRIHVVLSTQTVRKEQSDPASIPGSWQANISMAVALGNPDDSETLNNAFGAATRERAAQLGPRLVGHKGRGMTGDELSKKVIIFQSLYGWSPGTTSLDPQADPKVSPPTAEVRELWEQWEPISSQVPWLAPRLGIQAASPAWSDGDLEEVAQTPVVPLTDRDGTLRPGMAKCDPMSPEWLGAQTTSLATAALDFADEDTPMSTVSAPATEAESRDVTALPTPAPEPPKIPRTPRKRAVSAPEKKDQTVTESPARTAPRTDLDGW